MWFVRLVICSLGLTLILADDEVTLDIAQGTLKGLKTTTVYHGMTMYSFKGIPYAKPNVGPNKFQAPQAADGWSGVLDATKHGSSCVYFCFGQQKIVGDDDCLFLNVYTPGPDTGAERAVMVFIHGGGFNFGSGDDSMFGPDYLLEHDVVVVTLNYRLGASGFLSTNDANAPGNAGLKDQVMALKWIKNNIVNFGGSPNRVTIVGQNAGGVSVMYHMMSPMSTGLFNQAILQSGSALCSWALSYDAKETAMRLAENLGIHETDSAELVHKLAALPTHDVVKASLESENPVDLLRGDSHLFKPVVEADFGQEIFLPADPWHMIKSKKILDVPLIIGITSEEALLFLGAIYPLIPEFENNFDLFLPKELNMTDQKMREETGNMIKKFYFNDKTIDPSAEMEFTDLMSDVLFSIPVGMSAKIINSINTSPVYQYDFNFKAPFGLSKSLFNFETGVVHGDDLTYEFYSHHFKNLPQPGSREEKMTNEFVELWTNFAKTGDPSSSVEVTKVKWEPMGDEGNYLEISDELELKKSIIPKRLDLWSKIFMNVLGDYYELFN
ncbi:hypothetical protein HCN44_001703 [Aphidius gifuensis]|uniref:Carboxylesterase type B domain-containing protein n=1 Tax=Aphidius gifuensis TaxID=684658 RepID=A0A834XTU4_APHGI|nr:esterase FE4-like [Aphidius gifuensis]KAF7992378.1 hypothetical protein HCN44_001703 [Aphidius gifuensis]